MIRVFLYIILSLILPLCATAQSNTYSTDDTPPSVAIYSDSNDVLEEVTIKSNKKYKNFGADVQGDTTINFNEFELALDTINSWKNEKKYTWIKTLEKDLKDNLEEAKAESEKSINKNNRKIKTNTEESSQTFRRVSSTDSFFNSSILKIILWVLAGGFILFVIYNLFLSKNIFSKNSKQSKVEIVPEVVDENDMDNDFAGLQKKAYNAGNTRLAMRYLFLKMLQKLDNKQYVKFASDKTNAVYAREISPEFRNDFASLALYFEYIWYGKLEIEKETFDKIELQYNQFLNRI